MNDSEVKWLEKVFKAHKEEQQLYLDTRFNNLEEKINEVKDITVSTSLLVSLQEKNCIECRGCISDEIKKSKDECEQTSTKKVIAGSVITIIATITLWTAFGTDIAKYLLGLVGIIF